MDSLTRLPGKMVCKGVCLNTPPDSMPAGKLPVIENCRSYLDGTIQPRPGTIDPEVDAFDQTNVHTAARLNDDVPGATLPWIRIVGAGTKLYSGQAPTIPAIDTGFDGNPLSIVPYRPPRSPESWAYIANANKMTKTNVAGTVQGMGIAPPNAEPSVVLAPPVIKTIGDFATDPPAGWSGTNFSGALDVANRTSTTIAHILYDTGTTGWACINPTLMDDSIQLGALILIANSETVVVDEVINFTLSTTISQILYDSGSSGPCSIALSASVDALDRDAMLLLDNAGHTNTEYVRVLSATKGPDGSVSIRCSTAYTHIATDTVVAIPCFRAYTTATRAATNALVATCLIGTTTTASPAQMAFITSLDLGIISGRPVTKDDYISIGIQIDTPANLVEGKILLDIDAAGGAAGSVFTQNFYYKTFRASDITPAATGALTALSTQQTIIQRKQIEGYSGGSPLLENAMRIQEEVASESDASLVGPFVGSSNNQTQAGASQWTQLKFKVSDLQRIGSDVSRNLHNVCAIALSFTITGAISVKVNSFWIGGTYGPDYATLGYYYRTRPRSSATGAKGNPSPATRSPVYPSRGRTVLTAEVHSDTQVDMIDFFRFGGALTSWKYVGSSPNESTPTLTDDQDDIALQNAEDLEFDNFVPFPTIDIPRSGTCKVSGTSVYLLTGDTVNPLWGRGSQIIIGGIAYELDREPEGDLLQLNLPATASASVDWFMPNPTLLAQPMGRMWGPYLGTIFACGDPYQPGVLHATKANESDSAPEKEQYEVTGPSEPLMNGGMYDNRPFVFSSNNLFLIVSTSVNEEGKRWDPQIIPNSKGLIAPWMLAVGKRIYFGASDGIYRTVLGGEPESITRNDLYKLFPHEGQDGVAVRGFFPPDFSEPCQLNYAHGWLYFDYIDTDGSYRTMSWREDEESWWPDVYPQEAVTHCAEKGEGLNTLLIGCNDGKLYTAGGNDDAGTDIDWKVMTPALDGGDSRMVKQWNDALMDVDPAASVISVTPGFNNHSVTLTPVTITGALRLQSVIDFDTLKEYRNISLLITGSTNKVPILYEWQPSLLVKTESGNKTYPLVFGSGFNFLDYAFIAHKSSSTWNLTITVDGVDTVIAMASSGGVYDKTFVRLPVLKGKSFQFSFPSGVQVYGPDCEVRVKSWGDEGPFKPVNPFADLGVQIPSVRMVQ